MSVSAGSFCSGYGGLDLAVESFFSARTKWFSEYESAPSKVLAHHWPDVQNFGDMTKIDWSSVPRVDIAHGGTPCQDLSGAGKRRGMTEGTRSNLWVQMREAIAVIRPSLVIWENVRGAYTAHASSEVESEPGLLGETYGPDRPALTALGRVLGDFSELGYDAEWVGVRASDAGAPHGRYRIFVLAYTRRLSGGERWRARPEETPGRWSSANFGGRSNAFVANTGRLSGERGREAGHMVGTSRPRQTDREQRERNGNAVDDSSAVDWGEFEPAIRRWESVLGRIAPPPTQGSTRNGAQQLSARFEEWLMGLPEAWVTDPAIGLTWNEQVKALGNGVVPQQAELALSILWPRVLESLAA